MAIAINRLELMDGEIHIEWLVVRCFCHVSKIRPEDDKIPCVTSGTQVEWGQSEFYC